MKNETLRTSQIVMKLIAQVNEECMVTRRETKALRKYQRTRSLVNGIQLKRARGKARRVQRQSKKTMQGRFYKL